MIKRDRKNVIIFLKPYRSTMTSLRFLCLSKKQVTSANINLCPTLDVLLCFSFFSANFVILPFLCDFFSVFKACYKLNHLEHTES